MRSFILQLLVVLSACSESSSLRRDDRLYYPVRVSTPLGETFETAVRSAVSVDGGVASHSGAWLVEVDGPGCTRSIAFYGLGAFLGGGHTFVASVGGAGPITSETPLFGFGTWGHEGFGLEQGSVYVTEETWGWAIEVRGFDEVCDDSDMDDCQPPLSAVFRIEIDDVPAMAFPDHLMEVVPSVLVDELTGLPVCAAVRRL